MLPLLLLAIIFTSEDCLGLASPQHEVRIRNSHTLPEQNRSLLKTLRYTRKHLANNGDACITDCVENYCLTSNATIEMCDTASITEMKSPQTIFYTSGWYKDKNTCYSKCTKGTKSYWWCYVDEDLYWDYCNPSGQRVMTVHHFGTTMDKYGYSMPCKTNCTNHDDTDYSWCTLLNDKWDYCDPNDPIYYEQLTETPSYANTSCIGVCGKHFGTQYSWCYIDTRSNWDYCAQYADDFSTCQECVVDKSKDTNNNDSPNKQETNKSTNTTNCNTFNVDGRQCHGVREYIDEVEKYFPETTVSINRTETSIFSYTYMDLPNGIRLPIVVRALITASHIRATNSRKDISDDAKNNCNQMGMNKNRPDENNDVYGYLVSYQNGGSSEFFNIIPQPQSLNIGRIIDTLITPSVMSANEREITNFARDMHGTVELSIGIYYNSWNDNTTRPVAIGTYKRFHGTNWTTHCENKYSNEPEDDGC